MSANSDKTDLELAGFDLEAVSQTLHAFSMLPSGVDLAQACGLLEKQVDQAAAVIAAFVKAQGKRPAHQD